MKASQLRRPVFWRGLVVTALFLATGLAHGEDLKRPEVDTSALPALSPGWAELNPYRGNPQAIDVGRSAFNQTCARCHGEDANSARSPAPDLRRIGLTCLRVKEPALRQRCQSDADHYFLKSVRYGKQKFGIVHRPPWDGVREPALVWSIRSFVETAPRQ